MLIAKVHSAKVHVQDGIMLLLDRVRDRLTRLSHVWVDAGYQGRGKEEAEEWAKEGRKIDWQRLVPRRWVVERTSSWIYQNRPMSKDYERLCATAEAFVYVAMARLMVRRLARA